MTTMTITTPPTLVEAHGLIKRYGSRAAVAGVSLTVTAGEIVAVIGPNGAGKSTTVEIVLGLRRADAGTVHFWRPDPRPELGVQLQNVPFFRGLTVAEHLRLFASWYGVKLYRQRLADVLLRCGLADAAGVEAARLSGGQQKRLAIAMALAHHPRLIVLDEPTAALDPRARREIRQLIRSLAADGTAVVFTSHDMEEVGKLADRVILIVAGVVNAMGPPADLLAAHSASSLEDRFLRLTSETEEE